VIVRVVLNAPGENLETVEVPRALSGDCGYSALAIVGNFTRCTRGVLYAHRFHRAMCRQVIPALGKRYGMRQHLRYVAQSRATGAEQALLHANDNLANRANSRSRNRQLRFNDGSGDGILDRKNSAVHEPLRYRSDDICESGLWYCDNCVATEVFQDRVFTECAGLPLIRYAHHG
jgi:hypothetical protein